MIKTIILSHGNYAVEIIKSAESICGKQNNIEAITLGISDSLEEFTEKLNIIVLNNNTDEFLILVDFLGGTPYNATQNLIFNDNVQIVAGVNMPMVLKILNTKNKNLIELATIAEDAGKAGIVSISRLIKAGIKEDN